MKFEKCSNQYVSSAEQKEKSESFTGIEPRHCQKLGGRFGPVCGWSWVLFLSGTRSFSLYHARGLRALCYFWMVNGFTPSFRRSTASSGRVKKKKKKSYQFRKVSGRTLKTQAMKKRIWTIKFKKIIKKVRKENKTCRYIIILLAFC